VNLKNELGIEKMLAELGAMRAEMTKRIEVLERGNRNDRLRAEVPAKSGPASAGQLAGFGEGK